ncbi:hypothetical protein GGI25_002857 [Coemansia spiralis]|uniref:Enoyl reductase (ER) domain-containing protein n=2 Tax=Coemansia TaxID=4863 RepID=A0A9W8KX08_9FUNG|nr:chaperonin 10-like protein [Coemansia spiralis]KAJ1992331.1 hypothetical protein EDC05_002829 [Coemansia umbellata]KAJ2677759.1 hypothetical protein GGI25_002857 [Coemansia spiralis]
MSTYKAAAIRKFTSHVDDYQIIDVERKSPEKTQVEVQVYAASVNPVDYKRARGMLSLIVPDTFPLRLGYDVAGIVTNVGCNVTKFKAGDRVYGCVNHDEIGTIAEYVVSDEIYLAVLPNNIEFTVGASVPLAGLTAKQAMDIGGAEGKETIFVSGGMGGVGMFGVALARHYFKARSVITTVSTSKIEYAKKMGATQVVDYTKEDYTEVLENAADVTFDTVGDKELYKIAKPNTIVVSVALAPDGNLLHKLRASSMPFTWIEWSKLVIARTATNVFKWISTRQFRAKGVKYAYLFTERNGQELEKTFNPLLESKIVEPVIAEVYEFTNEGVRSAFKKAMDGHVAGKLIIRVRD